MEPWQMAELREKSHPMCFWGLNLPWWNAICLEGHAIPLNQPEWNQTANHFFQIKFMAAYGQQMNGSKIESGSLGQQHFVFFEWIGPAFHFRAHRSRCHPFAPGFSGHHLHSCYVASAKLQ